MQRNLVSRRYFSAPDWAILCLVATAIYGIVAIGREWSSDFKPITQIDLSIWALPYYTLLSGIRGIVAYLISLTFTLVVGYAAAKSKTAERIIIPLIDILQSVPVLAFLPGLILGLVTLFPHTNTGLELAAILMIFTGQVWNLVFCYYLSLKSVPTDLKEASQVIGLNWRERLIKVELPFSAVNLAWNSLLSMAGGWFFLIPCEAMTLGEREYRLPGIGAYMDVASKEGNTHAMMLAVGAMIFLIILLDFVIWRPVLAWVQRFRLEQVYGSVASEPLMQVWIRESKIVHWLKVFYYHSLWKHRYKLLRFFRRSLRIQGSLRAPILNLFQQMKIIFQHMKTPQMMQMTKMLVFALFMGGISFGAFKLFLLLKNLTLSKWVILLRDTLWTLLRVFLSLIIGTLWTVPVGIWLGTSLKRVQYAQPIIQILASFPAPMLYPLALGLFFYLKVSFDWASVFLMLLGVQWYVLFNVLAGALRIPLELNDALSLMEVSRWDRWKTLYLPSVFPYLVTGWVTAAGGAWNASIVAEYIPFRGQILKTGGLGATLSVATANGDFTLFAASLTLMIAIVILLNRALWSRVYHLAQTRFRMDL